ncbi:hypothetical protein CRUP_011378 [Coryphaenoides rupestris]|nr:hypothetical protein CRUP_011378 [Coryphaenoides rupestris]
MKVELCSFSGYKIYPGHGRRYARIDGKVAKKRTRRAVKFQRAITGASLADIMAKRNQKPEVRKAQREQAIRVELCSFSGYKIYPGHGRRYARIDGKVFQFLNGK